jgi:hypothetical protein
MAEDRDLEPLRGEARFSESLLRIGSGSKEPASDAEQ